MAISSSDDAFNPGTAPVDPNPYFNYSHSITQPKFTSVGGEVLSEAGKMIEGGLKAADTLVTTLAKNDARDKAYPERDAYMRTLEIRKRMEQQNAGTTAIPQIDPEVYNAQNASEEGVPLPTPRPADAPGGSGGELPDGARTSLGTLGTLKGARANGAISETDFWARTAALTKDVRSRYGAAYWPVIDQEVSQILGTDPANAYIKSVIGDINSYVRAGVDKEKQHWLDTSRKQAAEGNPVAMKVYEHIRAGGDLVTAARELNFSNYNKYKFAQDNDAIEHDAKVNGWTKDNAEKAVMAEGTYMVNKFYQEAFVGLNLKDASPQTLDEEAKDPVKAESRRVAIDKAKTQAQIWLQDRLSRQDKNGNTMGAALGSKVEDVTKRLMSPILALEATYNGPNGNALRIDRTIKANTTNADWKLLKGPAGRLILETGAWSRLGGDWAAKQWEQMAKDGLPDVMKAYSIQSKDQMMQPFNPYDPNAKTIKDFITDSVADKMPPLTRESTMNILDGPGGLLDPKTKPEEAKGIIDRLTHPKNLGFISSLQDDSVPNAQGQYPKGQMFYWNKSTSTAVMNKAVELEKLYPGTIAQTKGWVEQTFSKEVFARDVKNLNDLQTMPNLDIAYHEDSKGRGSFGLVVKDNKGNVIDDHAELSAASKTYAAGSGPGNILDPKAIQNARRSVYRINQALGGLNNFSDAVKASQPDYNVTDYLINTLRNAGFNPIAGEHGVKGMPEKMITNLIAAKKKQEELKKEYGND